jgi:hypothetical protein
VFVLNLNERFHVTVNYDLIEVTVGGVVNSATYMLRMHDWQDFQGFIVGYTVPIDLTGQGVVLLIDTLMDISRRTLLKS